MKKTHTHQKKPSAAGMGSPPTLISLPLALTFPILCLPTTLLFLFLPLLFRSPCITVLGCLTFLFCYCYVL
ncbi:hypothetical protein DFH06DRAFT_1238152, partial [Mycena polygramma]